MIRRIRPLTRVLATLALPVVLSRPCTAQEAEAPAEWTVVLYFDADGPGANLDCAVMSRLRSILGVETGPDVNVLALVDRPPSAAACDITIDVLPAGQSTVVSAPWSGAKLLRLTPPSGTAHGRAVELEPELELNMGNPATLGHVLEFAANHYPSRRTMLALKGHGAPDSFVCSDVDPATGAPDGLTIAEVRDALAARLALTRRPLDVVVLDACHMAAVDTLGTLGPYVEHFVAGEDFVFASSVPYGATIAALASGACPTASALAARLVAEYPEDRTDGGNLPASCQRDGPFCSLAAIPTGAVARVVAAFERLGVVASAVLDREGAAAADTWERLATARSRSFAPFGADGQVDAADLARRIGACVTDPEIRWAAAEAERAARAACTSLVHGADLDGACGITVAWPCMHLGWYDEVTPWSTFGWARFVRRFIDAGECQANRLDLATGDPLTTSWDADRHLVRTSESDPLLVSVPPLVSRREFFAEGSVSPDEPGRFALPFAYPRLVDGVSTPEAAFENPWSLGRFVFDPTSAGDTAEPVECPIDQIQLLAGSTSSSTTCAAQTAAIWMTLPDGTNLQVEMRLLVRRRSEPLILPPIEWCPPAGLPAGLVPIVPAPFVPPPWTRLRVSRWTAEVMCAFDAGAPAPAMARASAAVRARPSEGTPAGFPGGMDTPEPPAPSPKVAPHLLDSPIRRRLLLPGTKVHARRPNADGISTGAHVTIGRGTEGECVVYRRFPSGTNVTVGHTEWTTRGTNRSGRTVVTVP